MSDTGSRPMLEEAWSLSPSVVLREEPFGAMAYDFSTRRLSFLKSPKMLDIVGGLDEYPCALDACRAAGIGERELPVFADAMSRLADVGMLVRRGSMPLGSTAASAGHNSGGGGRSAEGLQPTPRRVSTTSERLADRFERGLSAPICLTWELTYGCNLSCVHCLSSSGRRDPGELSTRECEAFIDELEMLKVFYVNIGGGEPTIRRDFWHLLDYATSHRVGVKFSTNGTRITRAAAARLAASDYVDIQLSLDGATEEVNDAVRGAGSYAAVRRAMAHLAEEGFRGFKLSVVITRDNIAQLDQMKALADEHGAQLRLTRLRPSGRGADVWERLHPLPAQQRVLYDWLHDRGEEVLTGDSFFHLGAFGEPLPGLNLCGAGRVVCLIDPLGDVYACPFTIHDDFRAGSVRSAGGFTEVWRSSALFTRLREPSDGGACNACSSYGTCRGGCMASKYFTGLPLDGPDPECVKGHGNDALAHVVSASVPRPSIDHSSTRPVAIALSSPTSRRADVASCAVPQR